MTITNRVGDAVIFSKNKYWLDTDMDVCFSMIPLKRPVSF